MGFFREDGALVVEGPVPTSRASAEATLQLPGSTRQTPVGAATSPPSTVNSIGFQPPAGTVGSSSFAEGTGSRKVSGVITYNCQAQ